MGGNNCDLNQEHGIEMINSGLEKDSSYLSFDWRAKRKPESMRQTLIWEFTKEMMKNYF